MANDLYDFKINYIGIMGVKCIALSIPHISFYPKPLEACFGRVEIALFVVGVILGQITTRVNPSKIHF